MASPRTPPALSQFKPRVWFALAGLTLFAMVVIGRAFQLQVLNRDFLAAQGDDRHLRTTEISAHRGSIVDRHGEPLAVSTPVDSIWINPQVLRLSIDRMPELARALGRDEDWLARRVTSNLTREFVYVRRHMRPDEAIQVLALGIPGVASQREYRRYYPAGEVTGHMVGFTNIDDQGQEGLELAFDYWLRGEPGTKRVLRDRLGRTIEDVERLKQARPGKQLKASIDLRLQYLAYRELKGAIAEHNASAGSVVLLDVTNGEVLAMVNQPSFNPNDRSQLKVSHYRNRAVTDIFEPGSSFKPLVVAAALESGRYHADTMINTSPGVIRIGNQIVTQDDHDRGAISVTRVLAVSSNVGAAKIALDLPADRLFAVLSRFGIGRLTDCGFPGESAGVLNQPEFWRPVGQATLAYGYGLSVTALQLAQAYAALGAGGVRYPVSMVTLDAPPRGQRAVAESTATALMNMMEVVVSDQGTGRRAAIPGFRVAGKTGTAWKSGPGGYSKDRYLAVFAGLAPASDPRLAAVVVIDEPKGEAYYGGDVAAPVFARIVSGALRMLAVAPDRPNLPVVAKAGVKP